MSFRRKYLPIVVLLFLTTFIGPFTGNMILPIFSVLSNDFEVELLLLGASITVYMLPFSIVQLFSGVLSDVVFGRKTLVIIGLVIYSIGGFIVIFSPNYWVFLGARILQGIGSALILPITIALVGDIFDVNIRGRIMGILAIATTFGTTFGPLFGGVIAEITGV